LALRIEPFDPAPASLIAAIHERLAEAGQALREDEMRPFAFSVRGSSGRLIAGCKGEIAFRSVHVSEIWVSESDRGNGLGGRLLDAAEDLARECGCIRIHLETRNERARRLYERLGFQVFGELPEYEGTNSFYYLEKRLTC